jgi:predicted phosphodiesterase
MGPPFVPQPAAIRGTFAILGDCHSHRHSLRGFLDVAASRGAEFGILLGDFVDYDEDIAYHHFADRLGGPAIPVFLTRGNHEATDFQLNDSDRYTDYVPRTSIFFQHAGAFIGMLDNATGDFADGCLVQARQAVSSFRQEHPDGPVLLAMHMPPTIAGARSTDLSVSATRAVLELCDQYHVDYLVCGHVHDHIELKHKGTTILIDGCGGGSLQGPSSDVHYLEFSVGQGGLSFCVVPLPRDQAVLAKADYLLHVSVPRYRWWFFLLACTIVLREAWSLRGACRRSRSAKAEQATEAGEP